MTKETEGAIVNDVTSLSFLLSFFIFLIWFDKT